MMSDDFHKFFDRTTRLMERAMCEDHQSLFVDYTGKQKSLVSKLKNNLEVKTAGQLIKETIISFFYHIGGFEDGDAGLNGEDEKSSTRLSLNRFFHDER